MYLDTKVISYAVKVINQATINESLRSHVEPMMEELLTTYAIPLIRLTKKEIEDFECNPVEHIRSQSDITFTFFSAKSSALDMINYLATYRSDPKDESKLPPHLCNFLSFIETSLDEYQERVDAGDQPDWTIKEALISALNKISMFILKIKQLDDPIQQILIKHVIPDLDGENQLLKERACISLSRYNRLQFSDEVLVQIARKFFDLLQDHSLPIQVSAATSLYLYLRKEPVK